MRIAWNILELVVDIAGIIVGITVAKLAGLHSRIGCCIFGRAKSRGCYMYRGNAAQNSVEKKVMAWSWILRCLWLMFDAYWCCCRFWEDETWVWISLGSNRGMWSLPFFSFWHVLDGIKVWHDMCLGVIPFVNFEYVCDS